MLHFRQYKSNFGTWSHKSVSSRGCLEYMEWHFIIKFNKDYISLLISFQILKVHLYFSGFIIFKSISYSEKIIKLAVFKSTNAYPSVPSSHQEQNLNVICQNKHNLCLNFITIFLHYQFTLDKINSVTFFCFLINL